MLSWLPSKTSPPPADTSDAPLLTPEEIVALIEQADALRHTRAHGREVFLRHPGDARSAHFGQGLDFEEVRAYQAGDDIRNMDRRNNVSKFDHSQSPMPSKNNCIASLRVLSAK